MVSLGQKAAVNTLKGLSPKLNPLFPVNKGPEEWEANAAPLESWGLGNMKRKNTYLPGTVFCGLGLWRHRVKMRAAYDGPGGFRGHM